MPSPPRTALDLSSVDFKDDPSLTWRRLHVLGPVVQARLPFLGRPALATRRDVAREVLEDEERFSVDATRVGRAAPAGTAWYVPARLRRLADNLLVHEGPHHRRLRRRVDHAFRRGALERLQSTIDRRVDDCLDALEASPAPCVVRDVARPLPLGVISDLLGLPPRDCAPQAPLGKALQRLSNVRGPWDLLRLGPALSRIETTLLAALEQRRRAPRDDLLSALNDDTEGDRLDDGERISMVFLLYVAGHETTTHLMSAAVLELLRQRSERPDRFAAPHVLELVRALGTVQMAKPRFVVHDTELGGCHLPRGSTVAALVAAADQDDEAWLRPAAIDFTRAPSRLCGFGAGTHACLGSQLALRETSSLLNALFERFPDLALEHPHALPDWGSRVGLRNLNRLPVRLR